MEKNLNMSMLYDFYGELLTEKQAKAIDLYYNEDLSLSEIAEPLEISRQGVHDFIKRGEKLLLEYEEKLGLVTKFLKIGTEIDSACEKIRAIREYENKYINSFKLSSALEELEGKIRQITEEL